MQRILYGIIFLLSILLAGCNQSETSQIIDVEETKVEAEEITSEAKEDDQEQSSKHDAVDKEHGWDGIWRPENPQLNGRLFIYDETAEGFTFDLHVSDGPVADLENIYAVKDENIAISEADEYGCEITLTKEKEVIKTTETPGCLAWHGAGINFEASFQVSESDVKQFVIDENFMNLAQQGYLVEGTYPLGTLLEDIIENEGMYEYADFLMGAKYHYYENQMAYGAGLQVEEDVGVVLSIIASGITKNYTPEEVIAQLGEPNSQGVSESEGYSNIIIYLLEDGLQLSFLYPVDNIQLAAVMLTQK